MLGLESTLSVALISVFMFLASWLFGSESVVPLSDSVICHFFACGTGVMHHSVTSRAVSIGSSWVLDVMAWSSIMRSFYVLVEPEGTDKTVLKYKCHTMKKLSMTRTLLTEKKEGEENIGSLIPFFEDGCSWAGNWTKWSRTLAQRLWGPWINA